jgi:hypothetical protein
MLLLSEHREPKESSLPLIRLSSCLSPLRPFPASSNSHGIISFADPHPLNPVVSYRYINIGGQGPGSSSYFLSTYVSVNSAPWVASVLNPIPLFLPPSRDEKPVTATPSKSTVTNCDARNSFGIRFYENCRVSTPTIPILELTPSAHQPHPRPFFSCTYVEPILQPLCFDIHPCNGGVPPPQPANLQTFQRSNVFPSLSCPPTNHESPVTLLSEALPVQRECIERTIGTSGPSRQTFLWSQFLRFRLRRRVRWASFLGVGSSSSRASPFFVPTNN